MCMSSGDQQYQPKTRVPGHGTVTLFRIVCSRLCQRRGRVWVCLVLAQAILLVGAWHELGTDERRCVLLLSSGRRPLLSHGSRRRLPSRAALTTERHQKLMRKWDAGCGAMRCDAVTEQPSYQRCCSAPGIP